MKKSDVSCLALRILGIYLVAAYLPWLSMFLGQSDSMSPKSLLVFGVSLLSLVPGIALIAFSKSLSMRIIPGNDQALPDSSLSIADWQSIAFSAIAVLLIAQAVPAIVQGLVWYRYWAHLITAIIKLVIGLVLFLQARGLARLWKLIQRGRSFREESS